jgi:hypothetical protein
MGAGDTEGMFMGYAPKLEVWGSGREPCIIYPIQYTSILPLSISQHQTSFLQNLYSAIP